MLKQQISPGEEVYDQNENKSDGIYKQLEQKFQVKQYLIKKEISQEIIIYVFYKVVKDLNYSIKIIINQMEHMQEFHLLFQEKVSMIEQEID